MKFSKRDLNILTGFTLQELKGDKLVLIEDVQTSASSPKKLYIKDKNHYRYGAVRVILDGEKAPPYMKTPYPGHVVVSFRMKWIIKAYGYIIFTLMNLTIEHGNYLQKMVKQS